MMPAYSRQASRSRRSRPTLVGALLVAAAAAVAGAGAGACGDSSDAAPADGKTTDGGGDGSRNDADAGPAALAPVLGASSADLFAFEKAGAPSGTTEVHTLRGADGFATFLTQTTSALAPSLDVDATQLLVDDFNLDGASDLVMVAHAKTGSGVTEIHVLDGASKYQTFTVHAATAMAVTGADRSCTFLLGDYDRDAHPDLYVVCAVTTGTNKVEVHVLDGSHGFDRFLAHAPTALPVTALGDVPAFALADLDHDGFLDLYAIDRLRSADGTGGAGTKPGVAQTRVRVLRGADAYTTVLGDDVTSSLGASAADPADDGRWSFSVGDADRDGVPDVFALQRAATRSAKVEVTVASGADHFRTLLLRGPTALTATPRGASTPAWDLALARPTTLRATFANGKPAKALPKAGGVTGGSYAYAPSILFDGTTYHLFACNADGVHLGDSIAYTTSTDGVTWSASKTVLYMSAALQGKHEHTCDPSVLRFAPPGDPGKRTFYYLFYSANSFNGGPGGSYLATVNSVSRSLTIDGPYAHYMGGNANDDTRWVVDTGTRIPAIIQRPQVPCLAANMNTCYGSGEPTVVLRDGTLHLWYYDSTSAPPGNFHTTSTDGVTWTPAVATKLDLGSVDVKFDAATGRYVMIGLIGNHSAAPKFVFTTSKDGIAWEPTSSGSPMPPYSSETGFSGDDRGFTHAGKTIFGFAAPYDLSPAESVPNWELFVGPLAVLRE